MLSGTSRTLVVVLVILAVSLVGGYIYLASQSTATHLSRYLGSQHSLNARASLLYLQTCPTIDPAEFKPNSVLGFVIAGREGMASAYLSALVKLMIRCGVDLNQVDSSGLTPMHAAVLYDDDESFGLLDSLGADPQKRLEHFAAERHGELTVAQFACLLAEKRPQMDRNLLQRFDC
jgi:hypothetical protein